MKLISKKEIAQLLGMTRETVDRKVSNMAHKDGPKGAMLYPSDVALRVCLGVNEVGEDGEAPITLPEAQRLLTLAKKEQTDLQNEVLRKERVPLEDIEEANERVLSNVAGLIKAHVGKPLDEALVSDIFAELRNMNLVARDEG